VTPEQVALVRTSYASLGEPTEMAHGFYRRLFATEPSAEELFSRSQDVMVVKFSTELAALVEAIESFPGFAGRVRDLGVRHAGYRVETRHYRAAREALIESLAEQLGSEWSAELEVAWRRAYNLVAELMMAAGATVRPPAP
jgi:hemoglobin-like flavoprotein